MPRERSVLPRETCRGVGEREPLRGLRLPLHRFFSLSLLAKGKRYIVKMFNGFLFLSSSLGRNHLRHRRKSKRGETTWPLYLPKNKGFPGKLFTLIALNARQSSSSLSIFHRISEFSSSTDFKRSPLIFKGVSSWMGAH